MPDETFIPFGTSALTQGLFYTTALSSWTHHTPPAVSGSHEADAGDGDDDDSEIDTLSDPAEPPVRGSNFHLGADRNLSRGRPPGFCQRSRQKGFLRNLIARVTTRILQSQRSVLWHVIKFAHYGISGANAGTTVCGRVLRPSGRRPGAANLVPHAPRA